MPVPSLFSLLQRVQYRVTAPFLRNTGQRLLAYSRFLGKDTIPTTHVQPNPNQITVRTKTPYLGHFIFVGGNSVLAGDIKTDEGSQVYYNCVLKSSDNGKVELGKRVLIMDHVVVKADDGHKLVIGDGSIISSHSYLHNCTLGKGCFVGPRATVSVGCEIETYGGLAAGAVLAPGTKVPTRQFWAGSPAKYLRDITEEEVEYFKDVQDNFDKVGEIYLEQSKVDGATLQYQIDKYSETEGYDLDHSEVAEEMNEMISEYVHFPVTEEDSKMRYTKDMDRFRYTHFGSHVKEMLYDGNRGNNPKYLNELNKDYKLENDLKRKLEYDPEAKRMKKEEFEQKRIQVSDREFKRKF